MELNSTEILYGADIYSHRYLTPSQKTTSAATMKGTRKAETSVLFMSVISCSDIPCCCPVAKCVQLFVTTWTAACQTARPSLSPGVCSNSCPLSQWYHPTISSSVIPFSSCLQSFPASGSFPMSQLITSGGQSIEASASASVLPMNIQGWFPLGLTDVAYLLFKGLSRVFSSTIVWKHQFFVAQTSLWPNSHVCIWLLEKS